MIAGLWGEEFEITPTKEKTQDILGKIKKPKELKVYSIKDLNSKKISIQDKINLITEEVNRVLGHYADETVVISTKDSLIEYIDKAILNGEISIDTETNNSLDPLTCKLMGPCVYTPGMKNAYIPINHVDIKTEQRLEWQLTEDFIREQFQRLVDNNVKIIMHNAKFDYEVIACTCNIKLPIYWDTYIASRLIDENEKAGLKEQYIMHINPEQEKYSIEKLFEKVQYALLPPSLFALYAATDSKMTYDLYKYQKEILNKAENKSLFNLFKDVEMPCIEVVAEMELTGVEVDLPYCERLGTKYHKTLDEMSLQIEEELQGFKSKIEEWRLTPEANFKSGNAKSKSEQLSDPINLSSPTQLAILLYDVLKVPVVNNSKPRGTGGEELKAIYDKTQLNLCELLVQRKKLAKLVESFLDTLPLQVNKNTGRIHCNYKQIGADTGRFSCSNPNLQQIPSKNKEIRMMFKAKDGYTFVGSDFSQQEPRMLANYSKDENMINAYKEGKDLYATIASKVYRNDYWDNMEHHQDGTAFPDGKKRRSSVKGLLLGIMYGMGTQSIADLIKCSREEAQKIIDDFYNGFPKVRGWMNRTEEFAKKNGYVEDWYGRRRRLPDIMLEPYIVRYSSGKEETNFNPFLICSDRVVESSTLTNYKNACMKCHSFKDYDAIKKKALKEGVEILSNSSYIEKAVRQCVNARIQGGSATMTKIAMIKIYRDKELNELGFKLLIGVHDELIGECPIENADKVADRLCYVMKTCIQDYCEVPFKCDADVCDHWYLNDYCDNLKQEFKNLQKDNSIEDSFKKIVSIHSEMTEQQLKDILF